MLVDSLRRGGICCLLGDVFSCGEKTDRETGNQSAGTQRLVGSQVRYGIASHGRQTGRLAHRGCWAGRYGISTRIYKHTLIHLHALSLSLYQYKHTHTHTHTCPLCAGNPQETLPCPHPPAAGTLSRLALC